MALADLILAALQKKNYQFQTLYELAEALAPDHKPERKFIAEVHACLNFESTSAKYPFTEIEQGSVGLWGLEFWLPKRKSGHQTRKTVETSTLTRGQQLHFTLTQPALTEGRFDILRPTYRGDLVDVLTGMSHVVLDYYGSYRIVVGVDTETKPFGLVGSGLVAWYIENNLKPGDDVWLEVVDIAPLRLRIYTEWDRDADAYRRYIGERNRQEDQSSLPIRDLIYLCLNQHGTLLHLRVISENVLQQRPAVSRSSIVSCLNGNPHLFAHLIDHSTWGLTEWNLSKVSAYKEPDRHWLAQESTTAARPRAVTNIDYVLTVIHTEDLVYQVLSNAGAPLFGREIVQAIASYLGVSKEILERASFVDVNDPRFVRLEDGRFRSLPSQSDRALAMSEELKRARHDIELLKNEQDAQAEFVTALTNDISELVEQGAAHEKEIAQLKAELAAIQSQITARDSELVVLSEANADLESKNRRFVRAANQLYRHMNKKA